MDLWSVDVEGFSDLLMQSKERIPAPTRFFPPELRSASRLVAVDSFGGQYVGESDLTFDQTGEEKGSDEENVEEDEFGAGADDDADDMDDYVNDYGAFEDGGDNDQAFGDDDEGRHYAMKYFL
jgi:hypothetical protein